MSTSATYEWLKLTGCIPSTLDDPQKSAELDELLKGLYDGRERVVRGNSQKPHSPLIVTSNHAVGDSRPATLSRMIQLHFFRHSNGDPGAWDEMQAAQRLASGALPELIKLGYPSGEIRGLANELRQYVPQAHSRVGDSLGLVTWYAMAVAKLANFSPEAVKEYVIKHLCKSANDTDSGSDSLLDFIDKAAALHSETQVGWWSVRLIDRIAMAKNT